jgi:adenylosuccinate lyase
MALKELKLETISDKEIKDLESKIKIDIKKIDEKELVTKHDVFAFIEAVKENFGQEQK